MAAPVCIYQGIHDGKLPKTGSFLSVDKPNVIVSSVKQAEDSDDIIFRCVETSGVSTTATLDMHFAQRTWKGNFRPCEIKTLRMKPGTGQIQEVNLLEEAG